jgi:hypothetical protein
MLDVGLGGEIRHPRIIIKIYTSKIPNFKKEYLWSLECLRLCRESSILKKINSHAQFKPISTKTWIQRFAEFIADTRQNNLW